MAATPSKATSSPPSSAAAGRPPPLIPLTVQDGPTQRTWAIACIVAAQAYKLYNIVTPDASLPLCFLVDFGLIFALWRLRIPRLDYFGGKWAAIGFVAAFFDWMLLGGWQTALNLVGLGAIASWAQSLWSNTFSLPVGISEHRVRINDLISPSSHLLGQHTIHILPYSTATFASNAPSCQCIGVGSPEVRIPIFFNNTEPTVLQYSVTSLEDPTARTLHNVSIPKTSLISTGRVGGNGNEGHGNSAASSSSPDGSDALSWHDEVEAEVIGSQGAGALVKPSGRNGKAAGAKPAAGRLPNAYRTNQQKIFYLPVHQVGRIKLERVLDKSRLDARISRSETLIVECPSTTFISQPAEHGASSAAPNHKCSGEEAQLDIQVSGLAPLEVSYRRKWQGQSPRSTPEVHVSTISHISSSRMADNPLVGGSGDEVNPDDALDVVLNRRRPSQGRANVKMERDFSWAVPQTQIAPIALELTRPGSYSFELDSVKDACGNVVSMDSIVKHSRPHTRPSAGQAAKKLLTSSSSAGTASHATAPEAVKRFEVHPRAHANIVGCSPERPLQLLKGGPAKQITIKATNLERDVAWSGSLHYLPEEQEQANGKSALVAPSFRHNFTFGPDGTARVEAARPGTYVLESLSGQFCGGEVGSPWSCPVIEVPSPTAEISFSSIDDVCAGPVGVKALAVLSGTPPFRLQYEIRRSGQHPIRQERVIERSREEFEFRPSTEGAVQYRFTGLADANYRGLKLDGPVFEQTVHPLAKAQFVQASSTPHHRNEKLVMRSCEGSQVKADVSLEGTGPFDLTYVVRSGAGKAASEQRTVKGIDATRYPLEIALPAHINAHGGSMTVSLVSIKDGKSCERSLATSDLNIEIRRVRPTAGFISSGKQRGETVLLEGAEARLPIRLEGEAPWTVEYLRQGEAMPVTTTIRQVESALIIDRPGLYTLMSVKDAFCHGTIAEGASEWQVTARPRPSVQFDAHAGAQAPKNGSILRPAVCRGTPDSIDLHLTGHFPVEVTYEQRSLAWIGAPGGAIAGSDASAGSGAGDASFFETDGAPSSADARERSTFSAAQGSTVFQLSTEAPGWHVYDLVQVGDTSYSLSDIRHAPLQRLEQMVHPLPSAQFAPSDGHTTGGRHSKRAAFCVGDTLASGAAAAPTVQLFGTPPFSLEFELTSVNSPASSARFVRQGIQSHTFKLDVEAKEAEKFKFDKTGQWRFKILSLQDGNGCMASSAASLGEAVGAAGRGTTAATIEVADTADIAPLGTRQDYCVGETVEFVLSGSSPWTVSYTFNGHQSSATVRQPVFSRVAEKPGVLQIESVAHQQNKCKRTVTPSMEEGMRKTIHALPSVKVTGGGNYIEDLREGGQADIVFSLSGTPPFSLTYQRLEAADIYTHPKVLETHTVAGILEREHTISTSQEGTWRVTWLQDRWCSVSIDGTGRHTSEGRARLALTEK